MTGKTVELSLSVGDCESILSVLKVVVNKEKNCDDTDTELIESLTLLYEDINRELEKVNGDGHTSGLDSDDEM